MLRLRIGTRPLVLALASAAVAAAAVGSSNAADAGVVGCHAKQLGVSMDVIPGSQGAGQTYYKLALKNASTQSCRISGWPGLRLLGKSGTPLPTHVSKADPAGTAVLITLAPGKSASSQLQFSPDVPGTGESQTGPCEKTSYKVKVTLPSPASGTLVGAIKPPTPVCEHGSISEKALAA